MPKRTDWLTEIARPIAEKLAARCGSLKKVMSAGVMALNDLTPEEREYYMAKADGIEVKDFEDRFEKMWHEIEKIAKKVGVTIKR